MLRDGVELRPSSFDSYAALRECEATVIEDGGSADGAAGFEPVLGGARDAYDNDDQLTGTTFPAIDLLYA